MKFTVRPAGSSTSGGFAVMAGDAREALNDVRDMKDRGLEDAHVLDQDGNRLELEELERLTAEREQETSEGSEEPIAGGTSA